MNPGRRSKTNGNTDSTFFINCAFTHISGEPVLQLLSRRVTLPRLSLLAKRSSLGTLCSRRVTPWGLCSSWDRCSILLYTFTSVQHNSKYLGSFDWFECRLMNKRWQKNKSLGPDLTEARGTRREAMNLHGLVVIGIVFIVWMHVVIALWTSWGWESNVHSVSHCWLNVLYANIYMGELKTLTCFQE